MSKPYGIRARVSSLKVSLARRVRLVQGGSAKSAAPDNPSSQRKPPAAPTENHAPASEL